MLPRTPTFSRIWNLPPATLDELRREFDNALGSVHAGEQKHSDARCGEFSRSIKLHESLDPTLINAELDNGVLTLSIARRAEAQPRTIPVAVKSRSVKAHPAPSTDESK